MDITPDFLATGLLQHNYLPDQNRQHEELPPVLSSTSLSPTVARDLAALPDRTSPRPGYDSVSYTLTRFDHVPRFLSIPHPKPYSELSLRIVDNWPKLSHITDNPNSILHLDEHDDGRVFVMNYTGSIEQGQQEVDLSIGKRFLARTDIANFYPSVYSHAVPWALVGHDEAKRNHRNRSCWYNEIDSAIMSTSKGETHGIPVGPATSNIVADIILFRVDEELSRKYTFRRFNDDYTAFCETDTEASNFILDLASALGKYNLYLNSGKTKIDSLPRPIDGPWKAALLASNPTGEHVPAYEATRYLSLAVDISQKFPEASAVKYAIKALRPYQRLSEEACNSVFIYGLNLAVHQPIIMPYVASIMDDYRISPQGRVESIHKILNANIEGRNVDGVSWMVYCLTKHNVAIPHELAEKIVASSECIPMLLLYQADDKGIQDFVVDFAANLDYDDPYELDRYWMLLYQLYIDGKVEHHHLDMEAFEVLRHHSVSFVPRLTGSAT